MRSALRTRARKAARDRRLPPGTTCAACGEPNRLVLVWRRRKALCHRCDPLRAHRSAVEEHHPLGEHRDSARIPYPLTVHAYFTDRQNDWPEGTRESPARCSRLRTAAAIRALYDLNGCLIDDVLLPQARALERDHRERCDHAT